MFAFTVFALIITINTFFIFSIKILIFKYLSPLNLRFLILIDFVILKISLYFIKISTKTSLTQLKQLHHIKITIYNDKHQYNKIKKVVDKYNKL